MLNAYILVLYFFYFLLIHYFLKAYQISSRFSDFLFYKALSTVLLLHFLLICVIPGERINMVSSQVSGYHQKRRALALDCLWFCSGSQNHAQKLEHLIRTILEQKLPSSSIHSQLFCLYSWCSTLEHNQYCYHRMEDIIIHLCLYNQE